MYFYWNHKQAEIGVHEVVIMDNNDEKLPGTDVTLIDYTCDFRKNDYLTKKNVAFQWYWCCGWSHHEEHTIGEGLSLHDVMNEIETWILQGLISNYESAVKQAEESRPYAEWAKERLTDKKYGEVEE